MDKKPKKVNSVKDVEMNKIRNKHRHWKRVTREKKSPFFIVYKDFQDEHLRDISGGALKLYLYFGFHANNNTGECWHSTETIAQFFKNDERTVKRWIQELEERQLIIRIQKGFKWIANTFLVPYGQYAAIQAVEKEEENLDE